MMLLADMGSKATVVFGILLGLAGLVPTFVVYGRFWLKLLCSGLLHQLFPFFR